MWPGVEADGSVDSKTPSKTDIKDEMGRLEKVRFVHWFLCFGILRWQQLVKKYERGDLLKNDWLDKLAFRRMEEIHAVGLSIIVVQYLFQ